ncbi:MAG TPA: hypothetical protein VMT16_17040 [Thermoanaerobaculia bacterium]|nr:hypothetical protein [Thermoanaerobaculia bacterium]
MTDMTWILIALAAILIVGLLAWSVVRVRRHRALKQQFGPEYDRTVESAGNRGKAEKELEERRERVAQLELRPLSPARKGELRESWRQVELDFVDHPAAAVAAAEDLLRMALQERGYPVDTTDRHPEDLSVEHAEVMEDYRNAASIAGRSARGEASTEDLRQATQCYRRVMASLVDHEPEAAAAAPARSVRAS